MCNSPLQVQGRRAQSVGEDFPLRIEVGERSTFLHVRHHRRIVHPETAVDPATAAAIRQHCEERVLVNVVVTFAEAFRAVLVGRAEAVLRLAAQTYESVTAPFYLEQARGPLVESLACDATRFCGRPRASGYTGADVFFLVIITAFSREPLRPVPEIVLAAICTYEIIDAVAGQRDIGGVRVHLAVLEHGPLDVSTIETAHSISTNERSSDILCLINSVICAKYIKPAYLSTKS